MINEDKTILILLSSLVLAIFLDLQAKKQQKKIRNDVKKISAEELFHKQTKIEEAKEDLEKKLNSFKEEFQLEKDNNLTLNSNNNSIFLYYPKLVGKETQMYQFEKEAKGAINPLTALKLLQKGPGEEQGFVNAFYEGIQILNIRFDSINKNIHLYFGENFTSKNKTVMKDRIDQICLVLKQFKQIKEIYFWVGENLYTKVSDCKREIKIAK